jgi:hypothetical protein
MALLVRPTRLLRSAIVTEAFDTAEASQSREAQAQKQKREVNVCNPRLLMDAIYSELEAIPHVKLDGSAANAREALIEEAA